MAEALGGKVEGAVNAPQLVLRLGRRSSLRDRCRVDKPDQASPARLGRGARQRLPDQQRQPIAASSQALEQRDIRNIGEPRRRRPRSGRTQASLAQAVGQNQAQKVHRGCDDPRAHKGLRITRGLPECRRPAKPRDDALPILVHK